MAYGILLVIAIRLRAFGASAAQTGLSLQRLSQLHSQMPVANPSNNDAIHEE